MSTDTGGKRIDEIRQRRRTVDRLTPAAKPGQDGELLVSSGPESADQSQPKERNEPSGSREHAGKGARGRSSPPVWPRRLRDYGLALFFVGGAALLHWALSDVLRPAPALGFYLAWVGAAAFGGLGPGLVATLASWLCMGLLFDSAPGQIGFSGPASTAGQWIFLAGGLIVSGVGEMTRRARIRERRQGRELADVNAALRASEEKYRFLVENSKDVFWTVDREGRWTFISSNVEQVVGYRADEVIGKTVWDFLAPECHDLVKEKLRRRMRGEDLPSYEVLFVGKDGRRRSLEVLAVSITDDRGNIVGVQGVSRDITARKQAEETLRASQSMLRLVMDNVPQGIFWKDRHSRYLGCNTVFAKAVGLELPGDIVGKTDYDLAWLPEQTASFREYDRRIMENDAPEYHIIEQMRDADGKRVWVETNKVPLHDAQGHVIGILGTYEDITERRRAEEAMRASEEKYRFLVENSKDITWMIDLQSKWMFISSNIEKVTGYRADELIGQTIWGLLAPECHDLARENMHRRARGEDLPPYEVVAVGKDGRRTSFEVYAGAIIDDGGNVLGVQGVARDITERKRVEQDLRESRNRYQALIETTADFIWEMDTSGKYTYCSPQMKDLWGYEPEDMIGKTPFDVMPPEDRKEAVERFMSVARSPKPFTGLEASSYDSQGRLIAVEISGVPFFDADGRFLGYRGISRDVTERKRAQEALAESRKKYRGLVEKINDWVWEIDADGVYTYVSPRARELLGYAPEEIVGKTPFDFMPPAEAQRVRNAFEPIWLGRKPLELFENTLVRKDGRLVAVETSGMPVFAEDGTFLGYTGIDRDVTARRQAEEALRESEERYRTLFESSRDGIIFTDMEGRIVRTNPHCREMLGYPEEELHALTYQQLTPRRWQETEATIVRDKIMSRGYSGVYEKEYIRKDGTVFPVSIQVWLVRDTRGEPQGMWGIVRDITERKRAEEALRESEEKFRLLAETSPAAILIYQDDKYVYVNPAAESLTGYKYAELLAQGPGDIVHVDYHRQVKQMISRRTQGEGSPMHYELKIVTKDGQERWMDSVTVSIMYGNRPAGLVVAFDVTERKQAEEALRQEKIFTDKLLNAPRDIVFLFEPATGKPIRWNQRFAEVSGYDDEEIAGRKAPDDFLDEHDLKNAREAIAKILAEGQGVVEFSLVTKRGVHIPFEYAATVVETEDGKTLFLSIGRDVTERKRAEEALRESEERFRIMADGSPNPIWVTNAEGERIFANRQYLEYFGISEQEIERGEWKLFLHPDDAPTYVDSFLSSLKGHRPFSAEARVRRADGQWRWIESHAEPRLSTEGEFLGFVGITQDTTERKRAEDSLREWNATLESRVAQRTAQLQRRAGQLQRLTLELTEAEERERKRLAEILHDDLQQVLAAAKFQVGLLSSRVQDNAESREIAGHARNLLIDAIAKSRSLSHELVAPPLSQSDLGEAFEWLARQMQTKHGLTVRLDLGERLELASEPQRVLLYKAAQEALFNVIKHAGVREAKLRLRRQRGRIRLCVSDHGQGFDPAKPGFALGFGLLSIRERVGYLGGRMKIHSAPNKGSIFLLTVPDAEAHGNGRGRPPCLGERNAR